MILDLKGNILRVATNKVLPYVWINFDETIKEWKGIAGLDFQVVSILSQLFNFTIQIIESGSKWGQKFPNNTWNGIIGKVLYNEADIGIGTVIITDERYEAISTLYPYLTESVTFSSPIPYIHVNSVSLFAPFDYLIWITLLFSSIYVCLVPHLTKKYDHRLDRNMLWALIPALTKQQFDQTFSRNSKNIRLLFYGWLMSCLVLTSSYSGCLYSLMTLPIVSDPIETIYDLAESLQKQEINAVSIEVTAHYQEIKKAHSGVVGIIARHLKAAKTTNQALDLLKDPGHKYAYIETRSMLEFGLRRYNINDYFIPSPSKESALYLVNAGIVIQKNFLYKKQFNKILSNIRETGLLHVWRKQFYYKFFKHGHYDRYHPRGDQHDYSPLSLTHLKNVFIILIGLVFATFVQIYNHTHFLRWITRDGHGDLLGSSQKKTLLKIK